jgi:hypothetical protein
MFRGWVESPHEIQHKRAKQLVVLASLLCAPSLTFPTFLTRAALAFFAASATL